MKKEKIITIIVLLMIIIGDFFLQKYTISSINEIKSDLEVLKEEVFKDEVDSLRLFEHVQRIYKNWEGKNKILTFYIEHDELEKVNTELNKIKGYYEADMKEDSMVDINEAIYILEHIKEKQKLSLKNVF